MRTYLVQAKLLNKLILDAPRTKKPIVCYRGVHDLNVAIFTGLKRIVPKQLYRQSPQEPYDEPIYKKMPFPYFEGQLKIGEVVPMYGFTSTSLSPSYPFNFLKKLDQTSTSAKQSFIFLQFKLPVGYPGYYLGAGEYEFLLPCLLDDGTIPKFLVTGIKKGFHRVRKGEPVLNCALEDTVCVKKEIEKDSEKLMCIQCASYNSHRFKQIFYKKIQFHAHHAHKETKSNFFLCARTNNLGEISALLSAYFI